MKTWSTTQSVIALSSGEAEYYALVKAGSQLLGMQALLIDLGIEQREIKLKILTDATAAQGIAARRGLGAVRHIETNQLWLQQKVRDKTIHVEKVAGKVNIADATTKHVGGEDHKMHIENVNVEVRMDRHEKAPVVAEGAGPGDAEPIEDDEFE